MPVASILWHIHWEAPYDISTEKHLVTYPLRSALWHIHWEAPCKFDSHFINVLISPQHSQRVTVINHHHHSLTVINNHHNCEFNNQSHRNLPSLCVTNHQIQPCKAIVKFCNLVEGCIEHLQWQDQNYRCNRATPPLSWFCLFKVILTSTSNKINLASINSIRQIWIWKT